MKVIVLEGIDGCGKSTLRHGVHSLSGFGDIIHMRSTPSHWVYNKLYNRKEVDYESYNLLHQDLIETHVIWLMCSPEVAYLRQQTNERISLIFLVEADRLFSEYFTNITKLRNIHFVRTDTQEVNQAIFEISQKVYGKS